MDLVSRILLDILAPMSSSDPGTQPSRSRLLVEAAERAARYIERGDGYLVFPTEQALRNLDGFGQELADEPRPAREVLATLDDLGSPATVRSTGGRYFGFVTGGSDPAGSAAAVLTAAWDQNVGLPVMSPVGALLDELAARWCRQLLGLPPTAVAAFCSGASIANLTAILVARDALLHRLGWSVDRQGLIGAPGLRVVASAEIHASVAKALRAAGFGTDDVIAAPTDSRGRVTVDGFPDVDERTLVLLQAGNVNTGYSDPFDHLIPMARASGGWVHVDGAFGLWGNASKSPRHHLPGVELADSWAADAHKWLNTPYDCGLVVCREPADLRRAMSFDAAYLATDSERALAHLGLQMSQRARGVEVWAVLTHLGRSGVAALVDRLCAHAERMADRLHTAGVQLLVPPALNQVLVRFDDDATTDAVIAAVQEDRTCWVGGTTWQDRRAMRISVSDQATTTEDIEVTADTIIRCWRSVRQS